MDAEMADGDGENPPAKKSNTPVPPTDEEMMKAHNVLQTKPLKQVENLSKKIMRQLCIDKDILPSVTREQKKKRSLLKTLAEYVGCFIISSFLNLSPPRCQQRVTVGWFTEADQTIPVGGEKPKRKTRKQAPKDLEISNTRLKRLDTVLIGKTEDTEMGITKRVMKESKPYLVALLVAKMQIAAEPEPVTLMKETKAQLTQRLLRLVSLVFCSLVARLN
jgi:hypothetical protein